MTLRAKLVISFAVLLLMVIAGVGVVALRSMNTILIDQIDRTLTGFADRGPGPDRDDEPGSPGPDEPFLNTIAEIFLAPDGGILFTKQSGFADEPDPLPDVSDVEDQGFTYLDSVDGTLEYRAHVTFFPDGAIGVRAAPLDDVSAATTSLIQTLLLAGAGVLLIGGAATWWTVDRSMRPVGEMVETAEAIAAGDLTQRVPPGNPNTELGRLGHSLNEMLAHIEDALTTERDGRERLRRFVADASHELRTPVTAIAGYAELRRQGGLVDLEALDRAWSRIESESDRMRSLIEDLLMLARLGESQMLSVDDVDLAQIARDAATDHATIDSERPITVEGVEVLTIQGDEQRLHQVVSNLLANVRVHTPAGTIVTVEVEDQDAWAVLRVIDDGPGIPLESLEHVFDRFYRADPSRSRRSGGSGLGLSIVQAIVEAHGGTVDATIDAGGGARLTVRLPRRTRADTGALWQGRLSDTPPAALT
jgi:two-component system OmpR family sensor kinase